MESSEIGSVWHKWDMHIHTPETRINNQYKKPEKLLMKYGKITVHSLIIVK